MFRAIPATEKPTAARAPDSQISSHGIRRRFRAGLSLAGGWTPLSSECKDRPPGDSCMAPPACAKRAVDSGLEVYPRQATLLPG
ncbi:hypothetical protein GCM10009789_55010 [Kribbella sancticallisti]|uniref:Uncharacterized protein n=1 Tax=Kribbella sancticallisti TaxID=460087 RepID=A0ABN2E264_9ACTN